MMFKSRYVTSLETQLADLKAQLIERDETIRGLLDRILLKEGLPPMGGEFGGPKEIEKGIFEDLGENEVEAEEEPLEQTG